MATSLTPLQEKFAAEYLVDWNATQAAIRAGYSARTANRKGSELLQKPEIQKVIQKRRTELQQKTEITQERVLDELAAIAFADATDYAKIRAARDYNPITGNETEIAGVFLTDTDALTANQRRAIAGIKQGANGIEIKLCDKQKALELLGKYLGLFDVKDSQSAIDKLDAVLSKLGGNI